MSKYPFEQCVIENPYGSGMLLDKANVVLLASLVYQHQDKVMSQRVMTVCAYTRHRA